MRFLLRSKDVRGGLAVAALAATYQAGGAAPPTQDDVGMVRLAVTTPPADVGCIRISVMGSRNVSNLFDVTPGASSVLTMTGVPTGNVTLVGDAFGGMCSAVTPQTI